MTWPTGQSVDTSNVSSSTGNPSLARLDIYNAFTYLNSIIASANQAYGACVLNSGGTIAGNQLPNTMGITGDVSIEPTTKVVQIKNVLRLNPQTTTEIAAMSTSFGIGDVMMCSNGDSGNPCLILHDGTAWRKLPLSGLSTL
jgi:hypothetical protein